MRARAQATTSRGHRLPSTNVSSLPGSPLPVARFAASPATNHAGRSSHTSAAHLCALPDQGAQAPGHQQGIGPRARRACDLRRGLRSRTHDEGARSARSSVRVCVRVCVRWAAARVAAWRAPLCVAHVRVQYVVPIMVRDFSMADFMKMQARSARSASDAIAALTPALPALACAHEQAALVGPSVARAMKTVTISRFPLQFHCSLGMHRARPTACAAASASSPLLLAHPRRVAGKDRTGFLACCILGALGVSKEDM